MGDRARAVVILVSKIFKQATQLITTFLLVAGIAGARSAWSHPIHTTLTEVALDATDGTMHFTIRAFADDFSAAVAKHVRKQRPADDVVPDADIIAYVASAVSVVDASGKAAAVAWSGSRRAGDVVWVTFKAPSIRSLHGVKIASALLFELYDDQVNIVQATAEGKHHSMLFTAGDGKRMKALE